VLTDLPSHLVRISEEADLTEERLRVTTKLTYQYSSERLSQNEKTQLETLLIPLFTPEKGILIDNLSVIDGSGDEVTTLSQYDMRGLLAIILETFFRLAKKEFAAASDREPTEPMVSTLANTARSRRSDRSKHGSVTHKLVKKLVPNKLNELPQWENDVLENLIKLVCRVDPPADDDCDKAFIPLGRLAGINETWKARLKEFCRLYARHYAIVAEVTRPSGNQGALAYSQRLPQESSENGQRDHLRQIFGLSPTTIDLPLALHAFLADSYHLQINAPLGQFILDHHLEKMGARDNLKGKDLANLFNEIGSQADSSAMPDIRFHQGKAKTNVHLYIRRQRPFPRVAELKLVLGFREIPPGTLGGAAMVAGASALIITFFAVTRFGLHGPDPNVVPDNRDVVKAALNSDLPAILLALPAFVAALIGPWSDLSRIARAALSTYFGLVATLFLSVISVIHYILDANKKLPTEIFISTLETKIVWLALVNKRLPTEVSISIFRAEIIWLTLMVLAILLFICLVHNLLSQMHRYFKLVEHRSDNKTVNIVKTEKGR
ncbi:MAG: hypothetical protein ACREXR_03445, partial [Gammaproteobacteria bacterium]